jgi:hypothetical protein
MNFLLNHPVWLAALVLFAMAAPLPAASGKGKPVSRIEFSEPRTDRVNTNRNDDLGLRRTRLDELESSINRPFQSLLPGGDSLKGGILAPAQPLPPPMIQSQRVKELIDNKREWMFLNEDEMLHVKTAADDYKAPELTADGRDRRDMRPMERYFERISAKPGMTNQPGMGSGSEFDPFNRDAGQSPGAFGNPTMTAVNQMEKSLRNLLGTDTSGSGSSRAMKGAEFFGFKEYGAPASKPTSYELERIEQFKQILDFNNTRPATATTTADGNYGSPYLDSSFYDPPKPVASTHAPSLMGSSSSAGSSVGSPAAPAWSSPPAPAPAPAARPAPPSPFITITRPQF